MNKLSEKMSIKAPKIRPYASNMRYSYGNRVPTGTNFYRKLLKQILICIVIVLMVILIKSISTPFTNKTVDLMKESLNHQTDIKNTSKNIIKYAKELPQIPNKVASVFNTMGTEKISDIRFVTPIQGEIISSFGEKTDSVFNNNGFQRGVDILIDESKDVLSASEGVVAEIGEGKNLGKFIKIKHNEELYTFYSKCSLITAEKGQQVKAGEKIAEMHKESNENNSFLHFEVWLNDKVVDPAKYIPFGKSIL
ncbi:MAG: peptidoglycan DD-metalloendopeptidase family protein [Bacillota bacterium]